MDEDGALRVITHPVTFETYMERGFGALAQYCAGDMVAALGFIRALGAVSLGCDDADRLTLIGVHGARLVDLARPRLAGFNLEQVILRAAQVQAALAEPDYKRRLRESAAWLGGDRIVRPGEQ